MQSSYLDCLPLIGSIPYFQADEVNQAGCRLVTEVAKKHNLMIGLPVSTTRSYAAGNSKEVVQKEFQKQVDIFEKWDGDLIMAEVEADSQV